MTKYLNASAIILAIFLVIPLSGVRAQLSGGINYSLIYNDNPYRLSNGQEEFVSTYLANIEYQPLKEKLNLSYSFGLNDYRNFTDLSYNYHLFELGYSFRFIDTAQDENVSLAASYTLKQNNSGEALYRYNAYSFSANSHFNLSDNLMIAAGYRFNNKNYPSLFNLNYMDNSAFARLSLFLETNTAFHLESRLSNRAYSIKEMTQQPVMSSQHISGMGRRGKSAVVKTTDITQMLSTLKISQSITENTGINLYYTLRNNLNKNSSISLIEFSYSDDEDLWDDPFGFEGNDIGSEFLLILPWDMTFKLSGEYSNRRYTENIIDTLATGRQRIDGRREMWAGLTKEFNSVPLLNSLELGLEYMYIANSSSENRFTYKNNLVLFRIGLNF